jgi:hypothetical protein
VEYELDAFISKRHEQRVKSEGERQLEEAWRESKRREKLRQREENRGGWLSWYRRLERAAECGRRADALELDGATERSSVMTDFLEQLRRSREKAKEARGA